MGRGTVEGVFIGNRPAGGIVDDQGLALVDVEVVGDLFREAFVGAVPALLPIVGSAAAGADIFGHGIASFLFDHYSREKGQRQCIDRRKHMFYNIEKSKIGGALMELDYAQIGKHITARRKELGLKQTEVCDKAGIHDKYLILAISIITQPVKNILCRIIIFILQQLCSISILANLYHFRTIFIIANSSKIAVAASYSPAL